MVFAILMIIMSTSVSQSSESKICDCQISEGIEQSDSAEIIQITYKSVVLVIAIFVVIITLLFCTQAAKAGGIQMLYYQIVSLSLGLFFDCVGFVIYYSVNKPSAYFLIVLRFTELLPLCTMNGVVAWATRMIHLNFLSQNI
jgi:hypothetical protein